MMKRVGGREGSATAKKFLRTSLLQQCGLGLITTTVVKHCTYIYKITYTKHRYLPRHPFTFVSDHKRRDFCSTVCPFWLVAKVLDWPG